jgi:hypothetical protein
MKTGMFKIISLAVMVTALAGVSAQARAGRLVAANIPFNFQVEDKAFPAGRYTVEPIRMAGSEALRICSSDGRITAIVQVRSNRAAANQAESKLVFNRLGNQYFLSQVLGLEEKAIHALPKSHIEDELAKSGDAPRQQTVSVAESRR